MTKKSRNEAKRRQPRKQTSKMPVEFRETAQSAAVAHALERTKALKLDATALVQEQRFSDAQAIAAELLSLDPQFLTNSDPTITRDMLEIAGILLPTALFDPLEQIFLKAIQVLWNHKQATVADRFLPLNNLAALYQMKGDLRACDQVNSKIVAMADQLSDPLDGPTIRVFTQLARMYERAGIPRAAAILYRQLCRHVMSSPDFKSDTRLVLMGKYGNLLLADGQVDAALEMYEQALPALESRSDFDDQRRLEFFALKARTLQQKGNLDKAESLLEQARDSAHRSEYRDSRIAGTLYHNLASLYFQRGKRERYDDAVGLLEHAREIVAQARGRNSSEYAGEVAQLAVVVDAKGDANRAEALYRESFQIYESAPDADQAEYADFLTDAGFFYLGSSRPGEAVAVFQRATELRQNIPGMNQLLLANTLSNLATAHFESGAFTEAIQLYLKAIDLRHRSAEFCRGAIPQALAAPHFCGAAAQKPLSA